MRSTYSLFPLAVLFCLLPDGFLHAQEVESVTLYRDAAIVTWKADVVAGEQVLARSLFPLEHGRVHVMPSDAQWTLGASGLREVQWWSEEGREEERAARKRVDGLRLDVALKQAQLDIIEEDLAVLRANRDIGGTAESPLVEDLEEMADWMHDAFRESLYRRVELREELAALEQTHRDALAALNGAASERAFEWTVVIPEGTRGTVRTQVVESNGAGWSPEDQVEIAPEGQASIWFQRIRYELTVPHSGRAEVVFVDEWWSDNVTTGPGSTDAPASYERNKSRLKRRAGTSPTAKGVDGQRGGRSRHRVDADIEVGLHSGGIVTVGRWEAEFARHAVSEPKMAEVVDVWHAGSASGEGIIRAEEVHVVLGGSPIGPRSVIRDGDSLMVMTGVDEAWSVSRSEEESLCSRSNLGGRINHHRAYAIRVTNGSGEAGTVRIVESLPRSRELEIELNPDNLDGGQIDSVNEAIVWKVSLNAGESRTIRFAYEVEHERGTTISGFR